MMAFLLTNIDHYEMMMDLIIRYMHDTYIHVWFQQYVHLPKLHEYASVIPASKVRRIVAHDFNEAMGVFSLSFMSE